MALEYGYVTANLVRFVGDSPDEDRMPDRVGAAGVKVSITPAQRIIFPEDGVMAINEVREFSVNASGEMVDEQDAVGAWLLTGTYRVDFGGKFADTTITVTSAYTEAAPLVLANSYSYVPPPNVTVQSVAVPSDGQPGQVLGWTGDPLGWVDLQQGPRGTRWTTTGDYSDYTADAIENDLHLYVASKDMFRFNGNSWDYLGVLGGAL